MYVERELNPMKEIRSEVVVDRIFVTSNNCV